jgi:hypothetical protein
MKKWLETGFGFATTYALSQAKTATVQLVGTQVLTLAAPGVTREEATSALAGTLKSRLVVGLAVTLGLLLYLQARKKKRLT